MLKLSFSSLAISLAFISSSLCNVCQRYFSNDEYANLNCWVDASQQGASSANYAVALSKPGTSAGSLVFSVLPNSIMRAKVAHVQRFHHGTYEWRVYIPQFGVGDLTSVGAILYNGEYREVDFSCGYGPDNVRAGLGITGQHTRMVCFLTSQAKDGLSWATQDSSYVAIQAEAWYTFKFIIEEVAPSGNYLVSWFINGVRRKISQQSWGYKQTKNGFRAISSLENLQFMSSKYSYTSLPPGNRPPNTAVFDRFRFTPSRYV